MCGGQGIGVEAFARRGESAQALAFRAAIPGRENRPGVMTWPFSIISVTTRGRGGLGQSSATIHLNMAEHRIEKGTGAGRRGGAKRDRQQPGEREGFKHGFSFGLGSADKLLI